MILFRVLKEMLGSRGVSPVQTAEATAAPAGSAASFTRRPDVPSVLALTHSYRGNGAAEMLMFVLGWLVRDLGWQVNALSTGLPEADKAALASIGVGLVDDVDPLQYDFAIANTVVSGLAHVERVGRHLPCVLWVHEAETVLWNAQVPVKYLKQIFSMTAHLVFQSRWQAERIFGSFISSLPESRYSVIPNCLPTMPTTDGNSVAKRPGTERIVFIGGVYERKRPADLVEAVVRLARNDIECIFIGTTSNIATLPPGIQSLLETDPRFRLTGEVGRAEAAAYLASADVLSLPSGDESQPLVLLEAAHFNVPIVISDLPVYRDFWIDGQNCLKHAVGDIDGLAMCLKTCLDGKAPAPMVLDRIDVSPCGFHERFEKVLRSLLPARRADVRPQGAPPSAARGDTTQKSLGAPDFGDFTDSLVAAMARRLPPQALSGGDAVVEREVEVLLNGLTARTARHREANDWGSADKQAFARLLRDRLENAGYESAFVASAVSRIASGRGTQARLIPSGVLTASTRT